MPDPKADPKAPDAPVPDPPKKPFRGRPKKKDPAVEAAFQEAESAADMLRAHAHLGVKDWRASGEIINGKEVVHVCGGQKFVPSPKPTVDPGATHPEHKLTSDAVKPIVDALSKLPQPPPEPESGEEEMV